MRKKRNWTKWKFLAYLLSFSSLIFLIQKVDATGGWIDFNHPRQGDRFLIRENKPICWRYGDFSDDKKINIYLYQKNRRIGTISENYPINIRCCQWKAGEFKGGVARPDSDCRILIAIAGEAYSKTSGYFTLEEKTKVSQTIQLPPPPFQKTTPPFEAMPNFDLHVRNVSLITSSNNRHLNITYSTGNPNIGVVDRPLNFDVRVEAKYRQYPVGGPPEKTLELLNHRTTLPARHVVLSVSLPPWPHYITGVDAWITINPDRSIQETNYENNTKHLFVWERDRNYFKFHPWPCTDHPSRIFLLPWTTPPFAYWHGATLVFNDSMAKHLINEGYFKYFPAVNGDMLQVPIRFAVARHCAEPQSTKLIAKYITYNGPRTVESNVQFEGSSNVKAITLSLLLKIQRENFLEVWLENGTSNHRLNMRFDFLPWKLD